ncbi:MAG: LOG family protein [Alphaproteobacteria bacterium]|nr:LOG family protein [Alphaproteobacteria bacterium SS10]
MAKVLVSGSAPAGITANQLTGDRRHRLLGDLADDYEFHKELETRMETADAYVFMPDADPMLAMSVLVAKRIEPDLYWDKPVVFVEENGKRHPLARLFEDMSARGLAKEKPDEVFQLANGIGQVRDVIGVINEAKRKPPPQPKPAGEPDFKPPTSAPGGALHLPNSGCKPEATLPDVTIAVYCSASTKDEADIALATRTGDEIGKRGWGMTYGAGNVSMMGAVARGAIAHGTCVHGVTTEQVWRNNGELATDDKNLPMTSLSLTQDIYERMYQMFMPEPDKPVKGVMVLPGGAGSSQEMFAMLQLRKAEPLFKDVPLVIVNHNGAWNELIKSAEEYGLKAGADFHVFDDEREAMPFLDREVAKLDARPDWPYPPAAGDIDQVAKRLGGWRSDKRPGQGPDIDDGSGPKGPRDGGQPAP